MRASAGVKQRSNCLEMPYAYRIWQEESLTKVKCIAGVKSYAGVSQGQPEVKLFRNAMATKFGRKNPWTIKAYCIVGINGHAGVNQRSNW